MDFYEIMINLCIGVASGAFSSIIVSRFFLILSNHSAQLSRVQEHFENGYTISGTLNFYKYINNTTNESIDIFQLEYVNKNILNEITKKAKQECDKFDVMIFDDLDDELHKLAVEYSDFMTCLSNLKIIDADIITKLSTQLNDFQNRFFKYKNKSRYHFTEKVKKDPWLKCLFIIFILLILITILSIILH